MTALVDKQTGRKLLARFAPQLISRSKYRNKWTWGVGLDGKPVKIQSGLEAKRWAELVILYRAGEITDLERQVHYPFIVNGAVVEYLPSKGRRRRCKAGYVADFRYKRNGEVIVEDAKGMQTDLYRLKRALMFACFGIVVQEV